MRCVSSATCTSGEPVSPSLVAYSAMMFFLTSASRGMEDRLLLHSLRGAPGHVHLGSLFPRPEYGVPSVTARASTDQSAPGDGRRGGASPFRDPADVDAKSSTGTEQLSREPTPKERSDTMIILGLILLIIGLLAKISILTTIGIILLVVGAVLYVLGATGRAIGGRKHWYGSAGRTRRRRAPRGSRRGAP